MPEFIYKLATDEYYLPTIKSCFDAVYAYEGNGTSVIIEVIDNATI